MTDTPARDMYPEITATLADDFAFSVRITRGQLRAVLECVSAHAGDWQDYAESPGFRNDHGADADAAAQAGHDRIAAAYDWLTKAHTMRDAAAFRAVCPNVHIS